MESNLSHTHDVIIVGGGPAGCAAATVLAENGRRVLVLEREKFPRYHIGESLLPFTYYPLRRLGLIEPMKQSAFVKKFSVQFVSKSGKASQPFYFFDRYDKEIAQTWQVVRSDFDFMLMQKARESGADVLEQITVRKLLREENRVAGVEAVDAEGRVKTFRAPMTLDCTGKEAFAAVRNKWRIADPKLNKVAVWTYYHGARRDEGIDAGATTVAFIPEKGWFWYIPLQDDRVSVGVVAEGKYLSREGLRNPKAMFEREIESNPWIQDHLAAGTQNGPHYITSEFSFHSRFCGGDGLLLVGDAYCFLDPVFSSGLMLALKSGVLAGEAVHEALEEKNFHPDRFAPYARILREGIENMRKLVYAFYEPGFSFGKLTEKYPDLAGDITDCLSGDVNKDYTRLFNAVAEFCDVPEPIDCGRPKPPEPVPATAL